MSYAANELSFLQVNIEAKNQQFLETFPVVLLLQTRETTTK